MKKRQVGLMDKLRDERTKAIKTAADGVTKQIADVMLGDEPAKAKIRKHKNSLSVRGVKRTITDKHVTEMARALVLAKATGYEFVIVPAITATLSSYRYVTAGQPFRIELCGDTRPDVVELLNSGASVLEIGTSSYLLDGLPSDAWDL